MVVEVGDVTTRNFGGSGRGAIAGCRCWVPLQGAIVVCYGWGGAVTTNLGGVDVVPLLGAIVGCHWVCYGCGSGWRDNQEFWGGWTWCHCRVPLLGAIAGCHCSVLWLGRGGDDQFGGSGRGAIAGCHRRVIEEKLPGASCRRWAVLPIDNIKIGLCYLGSMLVKFHGSFHMWSWNFIFL